MMIKNLFLPAAILTLSATGTLYAATFVSSDVSIGASGTIFAFSYYDNGGSLDEATDVLLYDNVISHTVTDPDRFVEGWGSTKLAASFDNNLISVSGQASTEANRNIYDQGTAGATASTGGSYEVTFSIEEAVDFIFNATQESVYRDSASSSLSLQNLDDGSFVFSSDYIGADGLLTSMIIGTLMPGTYGFNTEFSTSSRTAAGHDNDSEIFFLDANLEFVSNVPVPGALWLFISGLLGLLGSSAYRGKAARLS